ncbi:tripartite tricarboxylate transporter permease [Rhizomonospora bruguierae]|uniref:tripartite tricarboxylate transporter permease n=1 Tax=Rhizomonospora bruguierae TaxID=1581705 RepID=UPI001BCBB57F|nr:tripartite tricarboxylate transporter permease [Micromonospora sp. NBRC 107566]
MGLLNDAVHAFGLILEPGRLMWLFIGILLGMVVGLLPGLGGIVGMTIMFPFIYGMDPYSGAALLVGILAVNTMSDSFPAVLLGIPGSSAAAATIMDGYPLAKQGKGTRTLGTVFFSSAVGGIIGGICLFLIIPVARPLVLALQSPELLMFTLLGISMVGVLSRGSAAKGVCAGALGLLLSTIGTSLVGTDYRYTFGSLYLWDGLNISIIAMGLFGIPEFIDMLISRDPAFRHRALREKTDTRGQLIAGIRDAIRHRWIVLRSSAIGVVLGAIPGLGGGVVDWILYGTAIQFSRDKSKFGKGDIRGVIAPESAANSREGGALMPTLLFGIPGSGGMAVLLAGFFLLGIETGPGLVQSPEGNTVVLVVVWTLVLANVVSAIICLGLARYMVRISQLPPRILTPFLFILIVVAAYQSSRDPLDIVVLLVIGALGWALKQFAWSRAAVLIGFVLGEPAERYLTISVTRYGGGWLTRPGVLAIGALIVLSVVVAIRMKPSAAIESGVVHRVAAVDEEAGATAAQMTDAGTPAPRTDRHDQPQEDKTRGH